MSNLEIHGRFLPSRVYHRWKWAVRLGLLVVPFLIFLSGGLSLYLAPNKYRSTILFSIDQGPPPTELVQLVKSRNILDRTTKSLELHNRWNVDNETAQTIIRENTSAKIVPDTQLIEVTVTLIKNTDARDIAESLPRNLHTDLIEASRKETQAKADEIASLIERSADTARETAAVVANLEKVHGAPPTDNAAATMLERARRDSLLADAEVERLRALHTARLTEDIDSLPSLRIHSSPVISNSPHSPKMEPELNQLALQCLGWGLLAALLLPYLLELAIPPVLTKGTNPDAVFDT